MNNFITPLPDKIKAFARPTMDLKDVTSEDVERCIIFLEETRRVHYNPRLTVWKAAAENVVSSPLAARYAQDLLKKDWFEEYDISPIGLLERLDKVELFYSGATRMPSIAETLWRTVLMGDSLAKCHATLDGNLQLFSGKETINWVLARYGTFREDLAEVDPVLELSLEKFYKILLHSGTFYAFKKTSEHKEKF